jgi:uncharacterized protein YqcC (DUF446 family)
MSIYSKCAQLLLQLEQDLKHVNLWSDQIPTEQQLNSTEPFALDTLAFEQWLQFIFIPKMTHLVNINSQLPNNLVIHPMAEESFKNKVDEFKQLLNTIKSIDLLFS